MRGKLWLATVALAFGVAGGQAGPAAAQSGSADNLLAAPGVEGELRAQQSALFQQMLAEPDNLDLMFAYAQVSIQVQDYEAAVSTLERMLIYRQDLPRVRLELGVAYFNLGSYEVAKLYFDQVVNEPSTPELVRERVGRYLSEIAARTRKHTYRLALTAGLTHASNATLGPDANQVLFQGNIATLQAGRAEADSGIRVTLDLAHAYDLGQEDEDSWRTELSFYGLRHFSTDEGDLAFVRVRTGPRLSLDERAFGPKIRPYLELQYLATEDRGLFFGSGVGVEYLDTLSPVLSVYGDLGVIHRNYFRQEFSDEDVTTARIAGGLAYVPTRDLILRTTTFLSYASAEGDQNSNTEFGLRLAGQYQYDPGIDWVKARWTGSVFVEARGRLFDEPDPLIDPNSTRRDMDFRAGVQHIFMISHGFGVQVDVDGLLRRSNVRNFDLDNLSGTLSLRYEL